MYFDPDWSIHVTHDARKRICLMLEDLQIPAEISIPVGDAPHAIAETAVNSKADLLVIGRGRGHIRTHSYPILRESPCPVVVV